MTGSTKREYRVDAGPSSGVASSDATRKKSRAQLHEFLETLKEGQEPQQHSTRRMLDVQATLQSMSTYDAAPASLRRSVPASAPESEPLIVVAGPSSVAVRSSVATAEEAALWDSAAAIDAAARRELPGDVLSLGVSRLPALGWSQAVAFAALAAVCAFTVAPGAAPLVALGFAAALSVLIAVLPRLHLRPQATISYGLYCTLAICLALACFRHMVQPVTEAALLGWSPVCVVFLLFAAVAPARTTDVLLWGTFAVLTEPLAAFLVGTANGLSGSAWAALLTTPLLGAGLSVVSSQSIHKLTGAPQAASAVGSYELVERLGQGAMGEVWRADHKMLARAAAIKLIRPQALTADGLDAARKVVKLFELEARATAALKNPHTIELFDFGVTEDGGFYYVMELLDGFDLQSLVEHHGLQPPERVAWLVRQVCESLHEAHEHGYVHRDLKPANVFACRYGGYVDFVKVLDFGLVLDRDMPVETDEADGDPGVGVKIVGTPAVIAPEMIQKNPQIDARADIYSIGCVAYWLLTGERVFAAETPLQMLYSHKRDTPVRPSVRAGIDIPQRLEDLVMACLDKNPDKRPQSAEQLADELAAIAFDTEWSRTRRQWWWDNNATGPLGKRLG